MTLVVLKHNNKNPKEENGLQHMLLRDVDRKRPGVVDQRLQAKVRFRKVDHSGGKANRDIGWPGKMPPKPPCSTKHIRIAKYIHDHTEETEISTTTVCRF